MLSGCGSDSSSSGSYADPAVYYKVTFNTVDPDASAVEPQTVVSGDPAVRPADPLIPTGLFDDWCKNIDGSEPWDFGSPIYADTVLYAKWRYGLALEDGMRLDIINGKAFFHRKFMQGFFNSQI